MAAHPSSGKMTTPLTHSYSNHCVIQVGPLGSNAMFEVVEISDAWLFSVTLGLNVKMIEIVLLTDMGATIKGRGVRTSPKFGRTPTFYIAFDE